MVRQLSDLPLEQMLGELLSRLSKDGCRVRGSHYRTDDYKLVDEDGPLFTAGLTIDSGIGAKHLNPPANLSGLTNMRSRSTLDLVGRVDANGAVEMR